MSYSRHRSRLTHTWPKTTWTDNTMSWADIPLYNSSSSSCVCIKSHSWSAKQQLHCQQSAVATSHSCSKNYVMLFRCTLPVSSIRHQQLLPFPGGVSCALKTRLWQLRPGRAFSISTDGASSPFLTLRHVWCVSDALATLHWLRLPCADFTRHHHINCLFHHSGSQVSVNTLLWSQHRSFGTCHHLTSDHPCLWPSSANV